MKRRTAIQLGLGLMAWGFAGRAAAIKEEAFSFGDGRCGKLQGGVPLPCRGANFESFAQTACTLGRNYLHPLVRDTVFDAYRALAVSHPTRAWQYGETGKAQGGALWPHKTHQNGLAVDFFVPVVDGAGRPAKLPISLFNKLGYGLEFRRDGRLGELRIDFRAIAAHLLVLDAAGREREVRIERVILTLDFHRALFEQAPELRRLAAKFMQREAWVRHDEHYHVDFGIPQRLRRPLSCSQ